MKYTLFFFTWNFMAVGLSRAGPSAWANKFPMCGNTHQSPINIETASAKVNPDMKPLIFESPSQHKTREATVTNNGHSFDVKLKEDYTLRGALHPAIFKLKSFHFHFGAPGRLTKGSEHRINKKAYPMEMHIVFYNSNYKSADEAMQHDDGLAVLGVFFEVGAKNYVMQTIIDQLPNIKYKGQSAVFSMSLDDLLPRRLLSSYYGYKGSLTTPPCTENVAWRVLAQPLKISKKQLKTITKSLYYTRANDHHKERMWNNYRPVQPLNKRVVSHYLK
ncbi:carbonic anhydrase 2-like isoform X2 [Protopterus annectens]|uniref:carbonic anhydrase 2-like isoform X2 n=1 Tax=Protopterus annectens TaxID=7888 RepID=UPI001CF9407F|nr:carbonic anhydrase 2-like isoform X2 [Protopterus annectens]